MNLTFESKIVQAIKPAAALAVSSRAKALVARGENIADLSIGEPDLDTPDYIIESAYAAMKRGETRYTVPDGTPALKQAIVEKFKRDNGLDFEISNISCANGAKQSIFNAMLATVNHGDEILVPAPYWLSYIEVVRLVGGVPKVLPTLATNGFKLNAKMLEDAITTKTRWLFLNSPNNPSGAIYSKEEFEALGEVLKSYPHVMVLSDEIYEHFIYDGGRFTSFLTACPDLKDRTVIVNGVSKTYCMTGWRIGYSASPLALTSAIAKVNSQVSANPSSISQAAAITALTGPQDTISDMVAQYRIRQKLLGNALSSIEGVRLDIPAGAFYLFPDLSNFINKTTPDGTKIESSAELATLLLEQGKVACVPGEAFGMPGYVRFSFVAAIEVLELAGVRVKDFLESLK